MINSLFRLSNGQLPSDQINEFTGDHLFNFYVENLGDISSVSELLEAAKDGKVNLELDMNKYVKAEIAEKIMKDNPAGVRINGRVYEINYDTQGLGQNRIVTATVKIPAKELFDIKNIPQLPNGRNLVVQVIDAHGVTIENMSAAYLDELKKKVSQELNYKNWKEKAPASKYINEMSDYLKKDLPFLPGPESIGVDPLTSEAILVYPAYKSEYGGIYLQYFKDQEESEIEQHKTLEAIQKIRASLGLLSKFKGRGAEKAKEVPAVSSQTHRESRTNVMAAIANAKKNKFGK
jgi:hypothetical protein